MKMQPVWALGILVFLLNFGFQNGMLAQKSNAQRSAKKVLRRTQFVPGMFSQWKHLGSFTVDSIGIDKEQQTLRIFMNQSFTQIPIRPEIIDTLKTALTAHIQRKYRDYQMIFMSKGRLLNEFVPNAFRNAKDRDPKRIIPAFQGIPLVTKMGRPDYKRGLSGNHIAVWPSHGCFYDQILDRWQWQRARLWQTVEDIFPFSFTSEYLVPMLENAGAIVVMPRERDTQVNEVIVDNDGSTGNSVLKILKGKPDTTISSSGFKWSDTLYDGQNPFNDGTYLAMHAAANDTFSIQYIPEIPAKGNYAVYISYGASNECATDVRYTVNYQGGKAEYSVNQCMGAGTWVYLGTFQFQQGLHADSGCVMVQKGNTKGIITTDAIRFGGGMGNVARRPLSGGNYKISGKPRWMEGSRYFLQYAGMPDSIVYSINKGTTDYNDDYMSRGEWVNYLIGHSRSQYADKYEDGPGIPLDMALAFHTDAGTAGGDSIIGTLGIYSTTRNEGLYPDGASRMAARDLTDLVQTSVVNDIRNLIDPDWPRRGLWDKEYSEAWRPIIPTMLLELQSHQNLADMKYGLDPGYKFMVARAIYKGILQFLKSEAQTEYIVQPLPPDHMAIEKAGDLKVRLSWKAVLDRLEPSAVPSAYRVYRSISDGGFDQGTLTTDTMMMIDLQHKNEIYSFRVSAVNEGGESFPGETLSVSLADDQKPVLIVNAFDRVSGPRFFDKQDMAGISWWEDEGVPDGTDVSFTGYQYDFDRKSEWLHDDKQGWGASYADMEAVPVTGNTHNFPFVHGEALRNAGYSFVSVSDEFFESHTWNVADYPAIDLIFGEERHSGSFKKKYNSFSVYTPGLIRTLEDYIKTGGNVFASGAFIGSDMVISRDSEAVDFASDVLHYTWRTGHATSKGSVAATDKGRFLFPDSVVFNTKNGNGMYRVESPDGIEPSGNDATRICRYVSGNVSAGVAFKGTYKTVILGFPFETITDSDTRNELMKKIMNFFNE